MNELSKFLVESILSEASSVDNKVVIYSGRFQPFHSGHYKTYSHLVKKFGKDNVYIGTSDKTDKVKSPFTFKEKVQIITKMFGIPSNKIVKVKNPYVPNEILKKFDKDTTAFVTVVGKKDAGRLGGKFFTPYKDNLDFEGYEDKGYVYIAPSQSNAVSGTEVRNNLKDGSLDDKKKFFSKRAYPKFNPTIFKLITDKLSTLSETVDDKLFIPKEVVEEWLVNNTDLIKEATATMAKTAVDDGPNYIFTDFNTFDRVSQKRAEEIGYTVLSQIMSGELTDIDPHPIYPSGPVKAVTPFPAGVAGQTTSSNQKDYYGVEAHTKWFAHVTRLAGLVGYSLVDFADIQSNKIQSLRDLDKERDEVDNTLDENLSEMPMADLKNVDKYADKQFNPIDVVLTDKHFFNRLTDTRNKKPISQAELIGFFKRLGKEKKTFVDFLNKYGQIVAKDNRTKLNIPFMQKANKVIAKTIMRKDDFKTSSPEYNFENLNEGMYEPKNIKAYYEALCKAEGIKPLPVKFQRVGKGGAVTVYNSKTMKPLYISFDVNRLNDPEFAIIHELTHQIKLETEGDAYVGKRDRLAKFKKLENRLIDKYVYSEFSELLYKESVESLKEDNVKYISKSLGVDRNKMPQIKSSDVSEFIKYLKDKNIKVRTSTIAVSKVAMTQKDINPDKVKKLMGINKSNLTKPVIISKDNYILDGHHRVVALYNLDKNTKLKTIKVDVGIKKLLDISKKFPKVSYKSINEIQKTFDRVKYYETYYKNLSPSDFTVSSSDNNIQITVPTKSNI